MRTKAEYAERPEQIDVIIHDDKKTIFIREDIEEHTFVDPEGNEGKKWTATEYAATVNAAYKLDENFYKRLIDAETMAEAQRVRAKRNALLAASDVYMIIDRLEKETAEYVAAVKEYRQALRDIPEQAGFPFDVVWPAEPERK